MSRTIEARAIISAEDKTGAVFDKIAKKINGMTKAANSFAGIKSPLGGGGANGPIAKMGWGAQFQKDLEALHESSKQLAKVQKNWGDFHDVMAKGPVRFANYSRAIDNWKKTTLGNMKEVSDRMQAHEARRQRFFSGMSMAGGGLRSGAEMAIAAGGIGGAAYMGAAAIKGGVKASSERAREFARFDLAGMSESERAEAMHKADDISQKFPSVGRTGALAHIRQLRARLGSFEHAIDNAETISKAQVVLGTLGHGGEHGAEDLEKLVLGMESQGLGNNPEKFKQYTDAFVRAKSLFPDLRGEDFRQYMKNANSSKYGLSDDYLQTVVPTMMQHEGSHNFGTMQASAFSALIGGRQTKAAKAKMGEFGLMEKDGSGIKNADMLISNPYKWATEFLAPQLEAKKIGMDEAHRGDVVKAMTQMFSNRKVGEFFASMLVNRGIIEKDKGLLAGAKGTEAAEGLKNKDPFVAWEGVTNQAKDAAAAFISMKPAMEAMNEAAFTLGRFATSLDKGELPKDSPFGRWSDQQGKTGLAISAGDMTELNRRDNLSAQQREVDEKLRQGGYGEAVTRQMRMRAFELRSGIDASNNLSSMPPIFSDAERSRWEEIDREHRRGVALSGMGPQGRSGVPMPSADPRKSAGEMPPVQSLEGANVQATLTGSAEVTGEVTVKNEITAGSALIAIVNQAQSLVAQLRGSLNANGPGSLGHSSPDAVAPSRGYSAPSDL
jgi:hypothetical protein